MTRSAATVLVLTVAVVAGSVGGASTVSGAGATGDRTVMKSAGSAKRAALAKCRTISVVKKRKACIRRVNEKYGRPATKPVVEPDGPVADAEVRDKYFQPEQLDLPRYGSVRWTWSDDNSEPHGITLESAPRGVSRLDFRTPLAPSLNYTFKRKFTVPGTYRFVCSMHFKMKMTVEVED